MLYYPATLLGRGKIKNILRGRRKAPQYEDRSCGGKPTPPALGEGRGKVSEPKERKKLLRVTNRDVLEGKLGERFTDGGKEKNAIICF